MVAAHLFMGTPCASSQITVYAQAFNIRHQAFIRFAFIARNMALSATSYAS